MTAFVRYPRRQTAVIKVFRLAALIWRRAGAWTACHYTHEPGGPRAAHREQGLAASTRPAATPATEMWAQGIRRSGTFVAAAELVRDPEPRTGHRRGRVENSLGLVGGPFTAFWISNQFHPDQQPESADVPDQRMPRPYLPQPLLECSRRVRPRGRQDLARSMNSIVARAAAQATGFFSWV